MVRAILGLTYEGFKLYVILCLLASVMSIPYAVAHWTFGLVVLIVCLTALMADHPNPISYRKTPASLG